MICLISSLSLNSSEGINVITNTNQYRISGNSLTFTPYAHNLFAQLAYFPQQYPFLSSIVEVDMETWIDITPIAYILCGAEIAVGEGPVDTLPVLSNNNVTYRELNAFIILLYAATIVHVQDTQYSRIHLNWNQNFRK